MNRAWYPTAIWLARLALPSTALNYWRAWDQLPMRMAVHFDAHWRPDGWTTKEGSRLFALCVVTFILVLCTAASYIVRARKPRSSWPVLISFYVALGFCWYGNKSLVEYNLQSGRQLQHSAVVRSQLPPG